MAKDRLMAIISGYLHDLEGIEFQRLPDGRFMVGPGNAAVYVDCYELQTTPVVHISAPVLTGVKDDAPLEQLATLNAQSPFGKFSYYAEPAVVAVEYEMLGDSLDAPELYTGMDMVAALAGEWEEKLQPDFGGELRQAVTEDKNEREV
jgi:hypothetical protein